jgi:hypothetical protein
MTREHRKKPVSRRFRRVTARYYSLPLRANRSTWTVCRRVNVDSGKGWMPGRLMAYTDVSKVLKYDRTSTQRHPPPFVEDAPAKFNRSSVPSSLLSQAVIPPSPGNSERHGLPPARNRQQLLALHNGRHVGRGRA